MTDRALLQQALEALEFHVKNADEIEEIDLALVTALRERLAQPEQEPVAHTLNCVCGAVWDIKSDGSEEMAHTPDTTPPHRKPLTDEEIESINVRLAGNRDLARLFARAIEAAHGIKENT